MRFCLGPVCRDLTPLPRLRMRYCAACRLEMRRLRGRKRMARYLSKPAKRASHNASFRRWWNRTKGIAA